MRARSPKYTAKPSPYRTHVSRPNAAIPNRATYVYTAIANPSARGLAGSE